MNVDLDRFDEILNSLPDIKEADKPKKKIKYRDAVKQVAKAHGVALCPDCQPECECLGKKLKYSCTVNSEWYGKLSYYKCNCCKTKFVSQNMGDLETAAIQ